MAEPTGTPSQPTIAGAQGVSPGGQVRNLGGAMSVQPGKEVQDQGQQLQVTPEKTPAEGQQTPQTQQETPAPAAKEAPAATGEDAPDPRFEPYTKELTEKGTLSAESITKAAKEFGVSEKVVKAYVDAQAANLQTNNDPATIALHSAQVGAVQEQAGGDKAWEAYREWAATNDPDSLQLIGEAVGGNSPAVSKIVVKAAMEKAKAQGYGAPRDITNSTQGATPAGAQGFASTTEQNAAINDPRYKKDAAYRKGVEARILATSL